MESVSENKAILVVSLISIFTGLIVLTGWCVNSINLESIIPGLVTIKVNAALCFIFLGTSLLTIQFKPNAFTKPIYWVLLILVIATGLVTFLEYLCHCDARIDQIFVIDKIAIAQHYSFPGRMALNTSICFIFLGSALLGLTIKKNRFTVIFQYFLHLVTIISSVALIGYLYGAVLLYNLFYESSMAINTAIVFFLLSIVGTLLHPDLGITKLFTGKGIGNLMVRRHFILMALMIIVFGSLRLQLLRHHIFSFELGISLLAIAFLLSSLIIIRNTAGWLNKIDDQRSNAEAEVKNINGQLEIRVEERSKELLILMNELRKSEERYRSLFEQASDAIYVLNSEGYFVKVNNSMCKMTGYSSDELLAMNVVEIIDVTFANNKPLIYPQLIPGQSIITERKFIKRGGLSLDVEVNIQKFTDGRVLVIARDITERKVLESELKKAELKFRTLADQSMVGIYIIQKGRFAYVNPRFADIFGYAPDELISTYQIKDLIHSDYQSIVKEHLRLRMEGKVESVQYSAMGQRKDGSANWIEFYDSSIFFEDEPTIIGSMIDVTESKKAENELLLSEQKYKMLFDSNPLPLWMIVKSDLSIIAVNKAAIDLYGYTKDELLHMTIKDMRLEEDMGQVLDNYKRELIKPEDMGITRHIKKDGTTMFVQVIADDILFEGKEVRLALTNDITEKIKAELIHQKTETNLQTILNTTDTAYALLDGNLEILEYNNKALLFVKNEFNVDTITRKEIFDHIPEERRRVFFEQIKEVLAGNNISYDVNYSHYEGSNFWYNIKMFPMSNKEKEILGIVLAATDITQQKTAAQNLQTAYDRIQMQIKFIRDIVWKQSHILRSPLANLKGLITILQMDPGDSEALKHIGTELERMDNTLIQIAQDSSLDVID